MCGIFAILNNFNNFSKDFIINNFNKGRNRGPDNSKLIDYNNNLSLGFHRLSINGLDNESNQPICIDNIILICNGEIYNYKELYNILNITPKTHSDCEVIIYLYKRYGFKQMLQMLDGVFAIVLYDFTNETSPLLYVARDSYGVRSLYYSRAPYDINIPCIIASEQKMLSNFDINELLQVNQFVPGTYSVFSINNNSNIWTLTDDKVSYHTPNNTTFLYNHIYHNKEQFQNNISKQIFDLLYSAVKKRYHTSDRPIACLLSGGLDSSLICSIVNAIHKEKSNIPLETFCIGLEGSEDLHNAQIVADNLGTNHTSIVVTKEKFLSSIEKVIYTIESYDTTTVRASIWNYLIGKYISENSDAKVIFNGDGSDELFGGYIYLNKVPDIIEFDKEIKSLLDNIHFYDGLRSDKCMAGNGLEARTPFLDKELVNYVLSIPVEIRCHMYNNQPEKYILRKAFDSSSLLPNKILWRTKEAFSDGVSTQTESLFEIIQNHINKHINVNMNINYKYNPPQTKEQFYYRNTYETYYFGLGNTIPKMWMPKYTNSTDPSARTLEHYVTL
jgi:asparagine synthase (glutamine-hydrolysing)